jgi:PAS domain S-box-containing protein
MRYLVASARWIRDNQLAGQDLVGRSHYDVLPATPLRWREIYARALAGAIERSDEDSYIGADGRTQWVRWEVRPFTNGIGDVTGIIVFSELITERVEAEQRQRESEQRLADYLATSSDWLWETDADHRFVSVTDFSTTVWTGKADVGHRRWELAGIEPGQDALWRGHRADLEARRPFRNFTFARRTAAGEISWREVSGLAVFDADGAFLGYRGTARDITARKLAESALRAQAAQLELAGEMAGLGHWHRDLAGRELAGSPGLARIAGRDVAPLGASFEHRHDIFHVDDRQAMRDEMYAALAERRSYEKHGRIVRPDGSVRDVVVKGRPEFAADGQLVGYFGIIQDVTEQNEAAARIVESGRENQIFRTIIETLPDQVFAKDLDSRFLVANNATFRSFGLARAQDLIGKTDHDFHPGPLADRYRAAEQGLMRDGRVDRSEHQVFQRGATQVFTSIKAPLRDPSGRIIGLVGIDRDITDLRHAYDRAEAHARDNELHRRVIESLPHQIFVKDRQGRFLLANSATARAAGLASGADLIGRHGRDRWPAELADRLAMEEEEILTTGQPRSIEEPFVRRDGSPGWRLSSRMPMKDGDGGITGLIGIERDITDLVRARHEIEAERWTSELYRQGVETLPELFYIKDLEHRFLVANLALARQLGAESANDVIGKTDADFQDPELSRRYRDEEAGVIAGGEVVLVEEPARRPDGTMGWFSTFKAPLRDAEGAIRGLVGQGRDITERKHAEATMEAQARELVRLADALAESARAAERARDMLLAAVEVAAETSDGFALFDPDDRIVVCNQAFSGTYGASPSELQGASFAELHRLPGLRAGLRLDDVAYAAWLERALTSHRLASGEPYEVQAGSRWYRVHERRSADGSTTMSRTEITHLKKREAGRLLQ